MRRKDNIAAGRARFSRFVVLFAIADQLSSNTYAVIHPTGNGQAATLAGWLLMGGGRQRVAAR